MISTSPTPENTPPQGDEVHTRRIVLVLIVTGIFIALLCALYLNGQSLYTHGL